VLGLAALAVPRVVLHDHGTTVAPPLQALLTVGPPVVWVLVAMRTRVPSPVLTRVTVGTLYGCALAVTHNLIWDSAFAGGDPALGGALAGELADDTEEDTAAGRRHRQQRLHRDASAPALLPHRTWDASMSYQAADATAPGFGWVAPRVRRI
jgi:hypothetical protein